MTSTRRLAAILAADMAGYSRLMGADEEGALVALKGAAGTCCRRKIEMSPGVQSRNDTPVGGRGTGKVKLRGRLVR